MNSSPKDLGAGRRFKRTPCGEIPVDWACVELGEAAEFVNGKAFKPSDWSRAGMPIIRIANLNGSSEFNYCDFDIESRYYVEPGDLLFSWSGSRGTSFGPYIWMGPRGALNQHIFRVVVKDSVHRGYCYFALKKLTQAIEHDAHGSAGLVHITKNALEQFCIPVPPLTEQQKIAEILESVDGAIEKTKAVIEQAKVVKKGLTQQLLTRGLPGRHKCFKKTPIGMIPEEWEVVTLAECLREPIKNGYSPNCPDALTGKWVLSLSAVTIDGFNPQGIKPAPLNDRNVERATLQPDDILVSRSNTSELVGLAGLYKGIPQNCSYSDLLMRVRVNPEKVLPGFMEMTLLSQRGRRYFARTARGTSGSMKKIDRRILEEFPLARPPISEQRELLSILGEQDRRLALQQKLVAERERMNAGLMHKLLTGRVRPGGG